MEYIFFADLCLCVCVCVSRSSKHDSEDCVQEQHEIYFVVLEDFLDPPTIELLCWKSLPTILFNVFVFFFSFRAVLRENSYT